MFDYHCRIYLKAGTKVTPAQSLTEAATFSLSAADFMSPRPSRSQLMPAPAMAMLPARLGTHVLVSTTAAALHETEDIWSKI